MHKSQEFRLLMMILIAFLIGFAVIVFNPEYRISKNLQSNMFYYADPLEGGGPGSGTDESEGVDDAETEKALKNELEF